MHLIFVKLPRVSIALSDGNFSLSSIYFVKLLYFILSRKIGFVDGDFAFHCCYERARMTFFLQKPMDIAVLYEVFVLKEYVKFPPSKPATIFDLGAHFGDTALFYSAVFPNAKIYSFEPSPDSYKRLVKHSEGTNIMPVEAAIGADDGKVSLNLQKSSLGHSLISREGDCERIDIKTRSLASFCSERNIRTIDILKFDVEGAEFEILENLKGHPSIGFLIGEIHLDLVKGKTLEDIESCLEGYRVEFEPLPQPGRYLMTAQKE